MNSLDKSFVPLVDVLMSKMNTMMDDKLDKHEQRTDRKLHKMQEQLETVADATEQNIAQLSAGCDETRDHLQALRETVTGIQNTQQSQMAAKQDDDDDDRRRQVIIHGFDEDTENTSIISMVTDMLQTHRLETKCEEVFTYTNPSQIGVITFLDEKCVTALFQADEERQDPNQGGETHVLDQ